MGIRGINRARLSACGSGAKRIMLNLGAQGPNRWNSEGSALN